MNGFSFPSPRESFAPISNGRTPAFLACLTKPMFLAVALTLVTGCSLSNSDPDIISTPAPKPAASSTAHTVETASATPRPAATDYSPHLSGNNPQEDHFQAPQLRELKEDTVTAEAVQEYVRSFFYATNYAGATGDLSYARRMVLTGCDSCEQAFERIRKIHADGQFADLKNLDNTDLVLENLTLVPLPEVDAVFPPGKLEIKDASGKTVRTLQSKQARWHFKFAPDGEGRLKIAQMVKTEH